MSMIFRKYKNFLLKILDYFLKNPLLNYNIFHLLMKINHLINYHLIYLLYKLFLFFHLRLLQYLIIRYLLILKFHNSEDNVSEYFQKRPKLKLSKMFDFQSFIWYNTHDTSVLQIHQTDKEDFKDEN